MRSASSRILASRPRRESAQCQQDQILLGFQARVAGRCLAAIHENPNLISELRQGAELGGTHDAYGHPIIISLHDMNCIQLSMHWISCRAPHAVNSACVARGQTVPVGNLHSVTDDNFKDKAQDHLNHSSFSHSSIYHGVVNGTVRPVGMEVFLDEGTTLVVNCIDERFSINFRFAFRDKAFYLLLPGSVQKKAQCVVTIA